MSLRSETRRLVQMLNDGGLASVAAVIHGLKAAGAVSDIHVGRKDLGTGTDACVEWYAGQLLSILEGESWSAVNSIINGCDKFCPEAL